MKILKIKAVLFDLGGTLIDDKSIWKNIDKEYTIPFWKKYGISDISKISKARKSAQKKFDSIPNQNNINQHTWANIFIRELGITPNSKIIGEESKAFMDYFLRNIKLVKHAKEILKFIDTANIKIILITNGWKEPTFQILSKLEIRDFFDIVIVSEDIGSLKSEMTPFKLVINKTNFKPEECIMVGDRLDEDAYAKKIGMHVVWIENSYEHLKKTENYDFKINDLLELKNIIKSMQERLQDP